MFLYMFFKCFLLINDFFFTIKHIFCIFFTTNQFFMCFFFTIKHFFTRFYFIIKLFFLNFVLHYWSIKKHTKLGLHDKVYQEAYLKSIKINTFAMILRMKYEYFGNCAVAVWKLPKRLQLTTFFFVQNLITLLENNIKFR